MIHSLRDLQAWRLRGVLFDMDGVLIDSTDADERSWLRWARFHGMESSFSVRATHGKRTIDTLRALRPDLDAFIEFERMELFDVEESKDLYLLPGVTQLIASLTPNIWTIVTSASEMVMRSRLSSVGLALPQKVVTAQSVTNGKPDPEPYLKAAKILNINPTECLVIEDSPTGVQSGKAAGCKVLAVARSHACSELEQADWIVQSLLQVGISAENDSLTRDDISEKQYLTLRILNV